LAVSESAAGQLLAMAKGSQATALPPRIVLVMVESMGLFQDEVLRNSLLTPLQSAAIQARYQVEVRQVPFHGQTINGEFRELCGVRLLGYGEKGFLDCLPKYLRDRGYQTLGLHGFTNQFYNRYRWYPMLGFEKSLFAQDLRGMGLGKKCGASFEGICDTEIAELIHQELLKKPQEQRKFLYWMTLNSHLPLDEQSSVGSAFDCSRNPGTEKNQAICLHSRMVHLVLENIAKIALDPALPPTQFIVVGDHSAPFLANTERSFYSQEVVPAIILEPR
jgi:phosphoglycerol transferase MdoB-like AlkP superfamily enzyme